MITISQVTDDDVRDGVTYVGRLLAADVEGATLIAEHGDRKAMLAVITRLLLDFALPAYGNDPARVQRYLDGLIADLAARE